MSYRKRDQVIYLGIRFLSEASASAQAVIVGWTIYVVSNTPLALGVVGIVQLLPMLLVTLPAGEWCDRVSPRRVLAIGLTLQGLCMAAFALLATSSSSALWPFYGVLLSFGIARGFVEPAGQALLPFLIAAERMPSAVAWGSSTAQIATLTGPALGGLAYAGGAHAAFAACSAGFLAAALGVTVLGGRRSIPDDKNIPNDRIARVVEGVEFVRSRPILLGAISLDLFAVLFGGATILLPIYARDILHVGPMGLGLLKSAPAVGACLVALLQLCLPLKRQVGLNIFGAVMTFGAATLVFAFSTSLFLSLAALMVVGASDMVSVTIRTSLVQHAAPDAMRGRVSAVSMMFIGASSELGAFESGIAATLLGTIPAVALGGLSTLAIAALWMWLFPALRKADQFAASD